VAVPAADVARSRPLYVRVGGCRLATHTTLTACEYVLSRPHVLLRGVQELSSPHLRPRHWHALCRAVRVRNSLYKGYDCLLGLAIKDVMRLSLHEYANVVRQVRSWHHRVTPVSDRRCRTRRRASPMAIARQR
jgi:hypothetical protein